MRRRHTDTNDLRQELKKNNIDERIALINPSYCPEGALCLTKRDEGTWAVTLTERGEYLVNESFASEQEACRFFLKHVLKDPTYRKDFKQSDLHGWREKARQLLREYGFDTDD